MTGREKLRPDHRERRAFVYVRQSTMAQVFRHRASTERQRELTQVAAELGWAPAHVELITEDLGHSGRFSEGRTGFERLTAELSLGHVGAIFSLDASRLARSSADWHRLVEIAALTRALLVDEHTIYDPRDPNDRLILGVKGQMADFELLWLRQRMDGGRWHLARKGEYRVRPPVGYVYDGDRLVLDPDEEVRRAVAMLFERYGVSGSCPDLVRYFHDQGLRFPARCGVRLRWSDLTVSRALIALHNPVYAGAYVYGRTRSETVLEQGRRRQRLRHLPMPDWPVVRHGAHPAYISWEEFMANRKRLSESRPGRRNGDRDRGAAREGKALLQGLVLCGRCSHRLVVSYDGQCGRYPVYSCYRLRQAAQGDRCVSVSARYLDRPVVELVLETLTRENLEAATKVEELLTQEDAALERQWKLRLERARYEAERAERQYDAVEPENRVVARTLETRWNEKLTELDQLKREYEQARRRARLELGEAERRRIVELAEDLPRLWRAEMTTNRDRKMLLRLLIQDVSVTPFDVPRSGLRLRVLWHTQAVSEIEVDRPGRGDHGPNVSWRLVNTTAHALPDNAS